MITGAILYILAAAALGLIASVVMSRASNRSALWNMAFAVVLLLLLIVILYAVALVITNAAARR